MLKYLFSVGVRTLGLALIFSAVAGSAMAFPGLPDVPEIDPSSMMSAMTLFVGGVLMLTGKRRKA